MRDIHIVKAGELFLILIILYLKVHTSIQQVGSEQAEIVQTIEFILVYIYPTELKTDFYYTKQGQYNMKPTHSYSGYCLYPWSLFGSYKKVRSLQTSCYRQLLPCTA